LCVDLDQIWAVGCSNGGMFTFELAVDERSASRLAGIIPIVGLPHYGYSRGPAVEGIRMMGMWGETDTIVPPISNTDNPDKTLDTSSPGWFYTSSDKVMSDWTSGNDCSGNGQDPLSSSDEEQWGISSFGDSLTCTQGCREEADSTRVVGCVFNDGHVCDKDFIWEPVFNFMMDAIAVTPTPTAAPAVSTVSPTSASLAPATAATPTAAATPTVSTASPTSASSAPTRTEMDSIKDDPQSAGKGHQIQRSCALAIGVLMYVCGQV